MSNSKSNSMKMTVGLFKEILKDYKDDENIEFVFNCFSEEQKEIKFNGLFKNNRNDKPFGILIDFVAVTIN